jgi:hypothetical protein
MITINPTEMIVEGASGEMQDSQPKMRERARQPVRSKLPWFRCRNRACQNRLVPIDVVDGQTCVRIGPYAVSYKIEITCEKCGTVREFVSKGAI